jgi:transcriptional regulator
MMIHPWDAAETQEALGFVRRNEFGHLIAAGRDRAVPMVVPTQFLLADDRTVLLHLARPNPIWRAIEENPAVVLSIAEDWSYVPGSWRGPARGGEPAYGIPTTYYAAVQLVGDAQIVKDEVGKVEILRAQIGRHEPDGGLVDPGEHARHLPGIQGLRITIRQVRGKFKYDGHLDGSARSHLADRFAERGGPGDAIACRRLRSARTEAGKAPSA